MGEQGQLLTVEASWLGDLKVVCPIGGAALGAVDLCRRGKHEVEGGRPWRESGRGGGVAFRQIGGNKSGGEGKDPGRLEDSEEASMSHALSHYYRFISPFADAIH